MKSAITEALFSRFGIFYAIINTDLQIIYIEDSLCRFLGIEWDGAGQDVFDVLPEMVGIEEDIRNVVGGRRSEYSLLGINRTPHEEIFFNIYVINSPGNAGEALVVIRDVTKESLYRQSIQQSRNEIELLQRQLMQKNLDLDKTNRDLLKSRDEQQVLNQVLEEKVHERTRQLEQSTELAMRLFHQTVNSLMFALEKRDSYTVGHQRRVSRLACAIARELGLGDEAVEGIRVAGYLHDIGKIYVPSEFLTKPGRLSEEEFNVIKAHPYVGFEILRDIEFPWPVASIVLQHHERIDGTGYPMGLEGDQIKFEAKILSVADVVEAMGTNRPYRISPGIDRALEEISKQKGIIYDAGIVDACIRLFREGIFSWTDE